MASLVSISLIFFAFLVSLYSSSSRKIPIKNKEATSSMKFDPSKVVRLSWHPRVFLYKGFLSDQECEHIILQAHSKLDNTGTVNNTFSSTVMLARGQDEIILKVEEKISAWTFLPKENGENMQISRYLVNETQTPHDKDINSKKQVATVLMYLSTVKFGGEVVFPKSELKREQVKDETFSECASTQYALKPVKGDALLVFNLHPNATFDENSALDSCQVLEGENWFATKRIHAAAFSLDGLSTVSAVTDNEECTDEDENCIHWAATGECKKNPVFMFGTPDYYGSCRKSCGAC